MTKTTKTTPNLTTAELAAGLKLSPRRVQQLIQQGMPTANLEAATAWRQAQPSVADSAESLRQHRIALLSEQTRKARLAADETEGKLVLRSTAEAESLHDGLAVRGALLSLETSLPGKLLGLRSHGEIRQLLHNEFKAILTLLSEGQFHKAAGTLEIIREHFPSYTPSCPEER